MLNEQTFYSNEKVTSAVYFARISRFTSSKENQRDFVKSYVYLRNLDDLTDNGSMDLAKVRGALLDEKRNASLPRPLGVVGEMHAKYGGETKNYFATNIDGFLEDNALMALGEPLPLQDLERRTEKNYFPGFQLTSLILFGRPFEFGPEFAKMVQVYMQYDALRDIGEDLPKRRILFPKEKVLEFSRNGVLNMPALFEDIKESTLEGIVSSSKGIYDTNFPAWFKIAFSGYFLSRYLKLFRHNLEYDKLVTIRA